MPVGISVEQSGLVFDPLNLLCRSGAHKSG